MSLVIAIFIFLVFIIIFILNNKVYKYTIDIDESNNCDNKAQVYYSFDNNKKIYTFCLDNIDFNYNKKTISLKEAIINNYINMDDIIDKLVQVNSYWNGDSILYQDINNKVSDGNLTIIKCNTIDGNHNYYIGDKNMQFDESFCK